MVKVTKLPPPPPDVYTARVQVEMSEAEWTYIKRCIAYYITTAVGPHCSAASAASHAAATRAPHDHNGFYTLDYSRLFRDSESVPPKYPELSESEKYLAQHSLIAAIKEIRNRLGLSLKEAKDAVYHYRGLLK